EFHVPDAADAPCPDLTPSRVRNVARDTWPSVRRLRPPPFATASPWSRRRIRLPSRPWGDRMTSRITAMFKTREAPALAELGDKSGTKRSLESARSHRSTEYGHRTRRGPGMY